MWRPTREASSASFWLGGASAPGWERRRDLPRRGLAAFLFFAGVATLFVWAEPLVTALLAGRTPPCLDACTTKVTEALDIGLIVSLCGVAGALVLRHGLAGYLLAVPLVGLIALLFPAISAATWLQVRGGVDFAPTVVIPVGGFLVVGAPGAWLLLRLIRAWASG